MTRVKERLNLFYHGIRTSERAEMFADVRSWLAEMDDSQPAPASLGIDTNWPLKDVLNTLADAVEHLGRVHDCDCHGWEIPQGVVPIARDYAKQVAVQPAVSTPTLHWPFTAKHSNCAECDKEYEPPHSPKGQAWHDWFDRVGEYATVNVVNATARLVIAEREIHAAASTEAQDGKE